MVTPSIEVISSGPTYTMINLSSYLANSPSIKFNLITFDFFGANKDDNSLYPFEIRFNLLGPKRFGFSLKFILFLIKEIRANDNLIIYNNSQYYLHSISIFILRIIMKFDLIFSPRGSLDKVSLEKTGRVFLKKVLIKPYLSLLNLSDYIVCTSKLEIQSVSRLLPGKKIFLLPNSTNPPALKEIPKKNIIMYLGRIVPQKGVHDLINAWRNNIDLNKNWELYIYGNSNDESYIGQLIENSREIKNIKFHGEVYADKKWEAISEAKYLVLPSYSENFGNVVIEAMACGTVPITTNDIPWDELNENEVGFSCDRKNLSEVLLNAVKMPDADFLKLSKKTRQYAFNNYHSASVAEKFINFLLTL